MSSRTKAKEIVVDVTKKAFQTDLAKGLEEDEILQPGRHKFKRGGFLSRHGLKSKPSHSQVKVRISINLDLEILEYFKQRASRPNAAAYQTQINQTLREAMEKDRALATESLSPQAEALLSDQRFIDAVAKKIKARKSPARKQNRPAA